MSVTFLGFTRGDGSMTRLYPGLLSFALTGLAMRWRNGASQSGTLNKFKILIGFLLINQGSIFLPQHGQIHHVLYHCLSPKTVFFPAVLNRVSFPSTTLVYAKPVRVLVLPKFSRMRFRVMER